MAVALLLGTVSGQQPGSGDTYVPGELLLKFRPTANASQRSSILLSRNITRIRRFETLDIEHVRVPPGMAVRAAAGAFQRLPGVAFAQPNYIRRAIQSFPPNDPFWLDGSLWGLQKIQAQSAWTTFTAGDGSVVIANIDTGVDYTHPDLAPNIWQNPAEIPGNGVDDDGNGYVDDVYGIDTVNHDSDPMDDQGHGTHTSGTAAASGNNSVGVAGVNWNAKVLACKFLSAGGTGTDAGAIECFDYIVALKNRGVNIRVSSNSWGAPRGTDPPAAALEAAIDAAGLAGIVNVFGAGNDGTNNDTTPFDPASYPLPSIVAVASSGPTDNRSSFSNYGSASVDLAAPGEDILSTYPGGAYVYSSGTSMATPHVAGAAALLAKMDPTLSVPAIKSLLLDNVDRVPRWNGRVVSGGRLNVFAAASAVGSVAPNTPPSVSITTPAAGATYKAPANIAVEATAADSDGTIQQVAFYANGSAIGIAMASPYAITWTSAAPGNYVVTAVATDNLWATTTSAAVQVTVLPNAPPTVSITNPANGATFTAPASVTIDATAGDGDGFVQQVAFYANGALLGTASSNPYSVIWNAPMGTHELTAVATDNEGATGASAAVQITVNPLPGRINVALAVNGGAATASSTYNANYPPAGAINGDRKGLNWGAGGGWNDGTPYASPDWLQVDFSGPKLIEEIDVFSMQDNYTSPAEPTPTMTFTTWGLRAFEAQYWDGTDWVAVPNGSVTANNLVWRRFVFAPLTTSRIRVYITGALNGYSRVMELEAWGVGAGGNSPPSVSITSPADGTSFTSPASITIDAAASDSDGSIQQVDFYADGAPIGLATTSPYRVTWPNPPPGNHTLTAVATDNLGAIETSAAVLVTVVASNAPPTVSITSPADGATFTAPASITLGATATDGDGTVQQVAFFANGAPIGTDTTSPYGITWTNVGTGSYTFNAVATDNLGATATSAVVQVTVTPIPGRINMALAINGAIATASSTYSVNYPPAAATNGDRKGLNPGAGGYWNDGTLNVPPDWLEVAFNGLKTIDEVDVFSLQDNYTSPVEPTPTMTFTSWGLRAFEVQYWDGAAWITVPGASVTNNNLVWRQFVFAPITTSRIRVYITAALNGYSRVTELEAWGVSAGGNVSPSVSITSPMDGATFTAPAAITVSADASDVDGAVTSVSFYANGAPIGSASTAPYSVAWTNVVAGSYSLTAVATDNQGATTTSVPVVVTVTAANLPPSVSIVSPAGGATFTAPASITVTADASDSDGAIASVAFYVNGAPIGSDSTAPYSVAWTNVQAGSYALTAVATDNQGATTSSGPVQVTVDPDPERINMALASNGSIATASSTYSVNYPPAAVINGDRKGLNPGAGGYWNDGTPNATPDWLEIAFNGAKVIDEVSVFSVQDNYTSPVEPTPTMTFTSWGLRAFEVQYWNGASWATVPGATVTNNNLVWRRFVVAPLTTTRIRIFITGALNSYSRAVEVEAWGVAAGPAQNTTASQAPADTWRSSQPDGGFGRTRKR